MSMAGTGVASAVTGFVGMCTWGRGWAAFVASAVLQISDECGPGT